MLSDMIQELEGGRLEVDSECCRAVATLQAATQWTPSRVDSIAEILFVTPMSLLVD